MAYSSTTRSYATKQLGEVIKKTTVTEKTKLSTARERFKQAADAEAPHRHLQLSDLEFLTGDQWDQRIKRDRMRTNRPCLTINKLGATKSQIVNEQRAQRPQIIVKPVGNGADIDGADMLTGLLRHIQVNSDAEIAVDTAFEHGVTGGKGYIEICADYLPGQTFDQELYIKRVKNPFTIYCDPMSTEPDESDANWKFKVCDYSPDEYKLNFPDTKAASLVDFQSIGDRFKGWATTKTIRVAEYWHKEWKETTLYLLPDRSVLTQEQLDARHNGVPEQDRVKPIDQRPYRSCSIVCTVMNAIETIEEYTFPGRVGYIPLIPFLGEDFDVNGKRVLKGIVRDAKDAQVELNFFRSAAAETIALAPKAPWVGWKGMFKDKKWETASTVNWSHLEADFPDFLKGTVQPQLPTRNIFEPPIQAIMAMAMAGDQDIKATTGIYEPSLGQNKSDQSGTAINKLQNQSVLTNLNYTDNLSRCLRAVGRVLLDAAPFIYDAPRVQRIIMPDGEVKHVILHSGRPQAAKELVDNQITDIYDLSKGVYDVVLDVGPSWKTRREEAFNTQMQLAQADKTGTIMKIAPDIIIGNSDMPGAREIAKRLKKTIPPEVLDQDSSDPGVQLQIAQSQLAKMKEQNTVLMQHNAEMMDTIKNEKVQAQKEIQVAEIRKSATIEAAVISAKTDALRIDFEKFALIHEAAHQRASSAAAATITPTPAAGDNSAVAPNGAPATGDENAEPAS